MTDNTTNDKPRLYADLNVSEKIGRLTADPRIIDDANGAYATFSIAVNKQYYDKDGEIQKLVNYFNVIVSSNLEKSFEVVKRLRKGDRIHIKGEDRIGSYEDDEGNKKLSHKIRAYNVKLLNAQVQSDDTEMSEADASEVASGIVAATTSAFVE